MRVLVADDHAQVRWALRTLIQEMPGWRLVEEVPDAKSLLVRSLALQPDLIVLDWELSGTSGGTPLADLQSLGLGARVVVLGGTSESRGAALAAGADAFVSKSDPPEALLCALQGLAQVETETGAAALRADAASARLRRSLPQIEGKA